MKTFRLSTVFSALLLACSLVFTTGLHAQEKEKSEADRAYDALLKLIEEKDAREDQARIDQISQACIQFVLTHASHRNIATAVDRMLQLKDQFKTKKALRGVCYAQVQSLLLNPLFDDSLSAETKAAVLALDTAMAEGLFRMTPSKDTFTAWQEKLNAQLEKKSNRDLLKNRAAAFYEGAQRILRQQGAEAFLRNLLESNDRSTSNWAKGELRLIEARKAPLELKFTALDGKEVDLASFRGKVVCLYFWSAGSDKLKGNVEKLFEHSLTLGAKQFPIITINVDPEADREKVLAAVKKERIKWPVHFDGQGVDSAFCKELNVTSVKDVPVILLIDQKGILAPTPTGKFTYDEKNVLNAAQQLLAPKK
jgi:cytochrome oxidase Cu insertion factor (SCO1/SenC/PrrC family)